MEEQIMITDLLNVGLEFVSSRDIGDSFQEWIFETREGYDMCAVFRTMRKYDFWEIILDRPGGNQITATRDMR